MSVCVCVCVCVQLTKVMIKSNKCILVSGAIINYALVPLKM